MADKINVLIPEETVDAKIKEIGEQISKDYAGKEVHLICILKGGHKDQHGSQGSGRTALRQRLRLETGRPGKAQRHSGQV